MKRLNYYFNKYDTDAQFEITLEEWLSKIQFSDEFSNRIDLARNDGTGPEGTIKKLKDKLPCITYNFRFEETKKNVNITGATGYLYIDVDTPGFDISMIDTTKIHAYYRSIRLQGYGIIVRVDGLTLENFRATYEYICKDLGLELKYDTCAKKATQFNVLSFDPDMFFNPDSEVYSAIAESPSGINDVYTPQIITTKDKTHIKGVYANTPIRYDNLDQIAIPDGEEYVSNWDEGFEYVKCWLPHYPLKDGRKKFILSYTTNLIWLNPEIPYQVAMKILTGVNNIRCTPALPVERLQGTLASILKQKAEGTLQPIKYWKPKRIVIDRNLKRSREEKMDIVYSELSRKYKKEGINKLESIIYNWDFSQHGKITSRSICKVGNMSNTTLNKYIKPYREIINQFNTQFLPDCIHPSDNNTNKKHISKGCIQNENVGDNIKQEQKERQPETPLSESGTIIVNTGMKIKEIKRNIKQVIDEFVGAGDLSFDAEIKLMLLIKDKAKEIHALDNSIEPGNQFSLILSYYNDSKLKVA